MPPSSMEVRRTLPAAASSSFLPTGVEPVKEILRNRESSIIGSVISEAEEPETTLITPAGRPASMRVCARYWEVSGVSFAGLSTMVQPAAMAGAILRVPIASGKFHGVMSKQGPTGLRRVSICKVASGPV